MWGCEQFFFLKSQTIPAPVTEPRHDLLRTRATTPSQSRWGEQFLKNHPPPTKIFKYYTFTVHFTTRASPRVWVANGHADGYTLK